MMFMVIFEIILRMNFYCVLIFCVDMKVLKMYQNNSSLW